MHFENSLLGKISHDQLAASLVAFAFYERGSAIDNNKSTSAQMHSTFIFEGERQIGNWRTCVYIASKISSLEDARCPLFPRSARFVIFVAALAVGWGYKISKQKIFLLFE